MSISEILNINNKEAAGKLYLINKYLTIILLVIFGVGIYYQSVKLDNLNNRFIDYITNNADKITRAAENSNNALKENNAILQEIKIYLFRSAEIK